MFSLCPRLTLLVSHSQAEDTNAGGSIVLPLLGQFVIGKGGGLGSPDIRDDGARPERDIFAGALVLVPTVTAAGLPNGSSEAAVDAFHKLLLRFWANFEDMAFGALHELQATHDIADLGFDHQDDGIVT